jgi:lipoate-protein ligase A
MNDQNIKQLTEKYASWDWRLGRKLPFTAEYSNRYVWGDLTLQFCVESGVIQDAIAYSDGMETNFINAIGDALKGITFSSKEITRKLLRLSETQPIEEAILKDILHCISENNF